MLHLHRMYSKLRKHGEDLLAPTLRLVDKCITMYTMREGTESDDPFQINARWMEQCVKDEAEKN